MLFDIVPEWLSVRGITLRRERSQDYPFLEALFVAVRWHEFDASGWPDDFRRAFLADQFALQSRHYALHYAGGDFAIVERAGAPVGRLYLFEGGKDLRIVDISLIAEARSAGLGTALLKAVQAKAACAGKSVSIHVEQTNPARNLYLRLGFNHIESEGPYECMEWHPVP